MVKNGKVRICISLDEFVYKKLCHDTDKRNFLFPEFVKTKSDYINELIDNHTKILEIMGLVKK